MELVFSFKHELKGIEAEINIYGEYVHGDSKPFFIVQMKSLSDDTNAYQITYDRPSQCFLFEGRVPDDIYALEDEISDIIIDYDLSPTYKQLAAFDRDKF